MFRDHNKKLSMMRVSAFICLLAGLILVLAGIVAGFKSLTDAAIMITSGAGLMGSSGWAKAIQTKWEKSSD